MRYHHRLRRRDRTPASASSERPIPLQVDTLQLGSLRLDGWSRAGDTTWLRVHPPGVAFDVGRGSVRLAGALDLFISHGHLDHALGVPFVLSYRTRHQGRPTRVFCPADTVAGLAALIGGAERLEGAPYSYELVGLAPGDRVEVGRDLVVEAFATDHVVPSLGYHLIARRRRLAAALEGWAREEILARRARGEEIHDVHDHLLLSYTGDTGPGVFDLEPRVGSAEVLVVECTFVTPELRDKGARYGHLHIDDLAAVADRLDNRAVVLHHLSRRHRWSELRQAVRERLPGLAERVHLLGERRPGSRMKDDDEETM